MNGSWNSSIRLFLDEAASASPTPGGGSVAALAAALGASMGSMVSTLTTGKRHEAVREQMAATAEEMSEAMRQCETLMNRDIESFNNYMSALALPKASSAERDARSRAIGQAAVRAAEVPLSLMKLIHRLLIVLDESVHEVNRNVISDWGIAALMLDAAAQSAWLTVEINVASINDVEAAGRFQEQGSQLSDEIAQLKQTVMRNVRARL
ncbi:cyclodeaminase/cyclohydrolase family protein [Paenibacillus sp. sptzw28]|uniref:cyclodeaminase/cyclohydrolase family protein n=1 Tax=Paenibacillus sp. sptzw28 TaxID=715179 RepID=UPI001C6E50FA|nr:cyclodeaminase/cyclohydrolase family protein [Paenibacillus sp. sptzw28]QYR22609.1 cyclodeaminase/cyclohydrolase family protein [Paenibacillus sp. sptzw28]